MLLAIDVGNTNIVIGVFRGETLVHSWRLTTIRERTSDELGILISDLCDRNEIRQADISGIVIDFGTATTFDAISAKGEYLGGVICPGPQISADALVQRTAKLPRIDVRKPPRVIGTNTIGAMQSGLFWGYVDMVEGLVRLSLIHI